MELLNSISAGEKSTITIEYFVTQILKPFPAAITQSEVQLVLKCLVLVYGLSYTSIHIRFIIL